VVAPVYFRVGFAFLQKEERISSTLVCGELPCNSVFVYTSCMTLPITISYEV